MIFLLVLSISALVAQNGIFNLLGKGVCEEKGDSYLFNAAAYIICIVIFAFLAVTGKVSFFSVVVGVLYGMMLAMSNAYKMIALSKGPMYLTTMLTSASMLIPTMSGCLFFGESFRTAKFVCILFLLFFICLSLGKNDGGNKEIGKHWFLFCVLCFVSTGMIGILQKIHQASIHKNETGIFLLAAFTFSSLYSLAAAKKYKTTITWNGKYAFLAATVGFCFFANHYLNLILSGKLPSQLFFPLVNATPTLLTIVISVVIFQEKLTKRQLVGLIGGMVSLVGICLF